MKVPYKLIDYVLSLVVFAVPIWLSAFTFYLFPWVKDSFEWWNIPHAVTAFFFPFYVWRYFGLEIK